MAVPNSRATLKTYCKRRLGSGMVDINITSDQEDDVIDDALQFYQDYHYDAIVRSFLKHQVTSSDKTNKYITDEMPNIMTGHFSNNIITNLKD